MTDTPTTPFTATTEYVVLEHIDLPAPAFDGLGPPELHAWREVARVTARDTTQAIKQYLVHATDVDSQFVATPTRSWKPVPVKTRIALDFGSET